MSKSFTLSSLEGVGPVRSAGTSTESTTIHSKHPGLYSCSGDEVRKSGSVDQGFESELSFVTLSPLRATFAHKFFGLLVLCVGGRHIAVRY